MSTDTCYLSLNDFSGQNRESELIRSILLALFLGTFSSCDSIDRTEIVRVASPDSVVEAVVLRTNAGATTPFVYELFVVKTGSVPELGTALFKADQVEDLNVFWQSNKLLVIGYTSARVFHFANFWQSRDVQNLLYIVRIQLSPKQSAG